MAHKIKRTATLLASALVSGAALAAPKPFDIQLARELASNPAYPLPTDEEGVMHSIVRCGPGQRVCEEKELDLNGDGHVDLVVGVNQEGNKRVYLGRGDGLFHEALYRGLVTTTSGLKFADLDGDGDLDMVETVRGDGAVGQNLVYVNRDGTLDSLFNDEQTLDYPFPTKHDRSSSVAIGDVNGDGKLDIVIGNETAGGHDTALPKTNYLYLNTTTSANTGVKFAAAIALDAPGTETYTRRVLLVDVDNDDDLDLVATSADTAADDAGNGNVLYLNTGASPNPFAAAVPLNADTADDTDVANGIAAGDLNGDGKMDLLFSTWSRSGNLGGASSRYYVNSSTPGNINFETTGTFGPNEHGTNVRLGDFDTDGDLDAVVLTFEDRNRLHLNNGGILNDAGIALDEPTGLAVDRSRGIDIADINEDGYLDLLILNRNQLGLRYLNNGQCSTGGCGTFAHPFQNYGPNITAQIATATTPPGGAAIDMGFHLGALDVVDTDNVYPSDFEALPVPSAPEYTCTLGTNTGRFVGTCIDGMITPGGSAGDDGFIRPIIIRVDDGQSTSNRLNTFALTIGTGSAPTFTTTTLPAATEDIAYSTTLAATDLDGDSPLTYEADSPLPSWLQLSTAGVLSSATGTVPQQGDVGVHTLKVRVRDPGGLQSIGTLTLTVNNVNDAPTVTTTTLPDGTQGQAYAGATVTGGDDDPGTTLTFLSTGLPDGLTMSSAGVISGTPTVSGTFTIVLTANDGTVTSAPVNASLLIVAAAGTNAAPVLTAPGPQTATVGTAFNLAVAATDADADTLQFTATGLPADLSMSTAGVISGTPTSTTGSPFTVTVNVSDGRGGTDSETFQLTIQPAGNSVPVFTAPPSQSGTVGTAFNLSLAGSATDADGDPLTFAATGLPPGITLSTAGLMSGSPTTASGSPFTVAVTVSDGKGGIASGSFSMTVSNPTSGGGGGGDSGGGGGSFGFLEVLALFGMGALATRRRRLAASR